MTKQDFTSNVMCILFSSEELRRAVPHATACFILFCKEVRGIVYICCYALLFMGEQEVLLALLLLYFSYLHSKERHPGRELWKCVGGEKLLKAGEVVL